MTNKKLKELVLYLASESADDESFGSTKLNKLLFLIDFQAYALWGSSISGAKYVRRKFGPVPFELPIVRSELESEGKLKVESRQRFGKPQKRVLALGNPDLSVFSKDEIELAKEIIKDLKEVNGTVLSDWTHKLRPWLDTEDGEEIPYYTVFILKDVPVSLSDLAWGRKKLEELKATGYAV